MRDFLLSILMPLTPKRLMSFLFGEFARLRFPNPFRAIIIRSFVSFYKINMDEAEKPIDRYRTLDALFTRRLKPGARPIQSDWIHPVDGELTANGLILKDQAFQIKGWNYSIGKLLGEQRYDFDRGVFLTYYLCPRDYHRVHSPVSGEILSVRHIQGQLWPVNDWSVSRIQELFCQNERVVVNMLTDRGYVSVILVGATNVGQIEIKCAPNLRTNLPAGHTPYFQNFTPPIKVQVGDELGVFHLGSTVVVLMSPDFAKGYVELPRGNVRMGEY
jgi:phosphatidylserine decarboxylase